MVNNPAPTPAEDENIVGNGTCAEGSSKSVETTDMTTPYPGNQGSAPTASPCNEYSAIVDFMASAAPTTSPYYQWQYVAHDAASIWSAPLAVKHLYNAYSPAPNKSTQPFAVDPDAENFVLNVVGSTSPAPNPIRPFAELTFLTPCETESDHPNSKGGTIGIDNGPPWLAYIVNSVESSEYWPNTAIIVTWDDWGGFYDGYTPAPWPRHPSPPPTPYNSSDPDEWGFRVPLIVVSPWLKTQGYISTSVRSQGAILNFIETVFSLPTHALNGDDLSNKSDDLTDMFNFSRITPTLPPVTLTPAFSPANINTCPN